MGEGNTPENGNDGIGGKDITFGLVLIIVVAAVGAVIWYMVSGESKVGDSAPEPKKVEVTSPSTCISSWDGQHIRMKRQIAGLVESNGLTGFKHKYTGYNPRNATAGQQVTMWTCFSAMKRNGRPVDMMVYYKTTVPSSSNINTNDPNWCPIYDVQTQVGCE